MAPAPNNPNGEGEDGRGIDTIHALSSGAPPAAIAIIRVSGSAAQRILVDLAGQCPPPRHASLRTLRDEDGASLDHALILWFPGPITATGEDLVELHLHGGRAVVAAVQAALLRHGSRLAQPGEFTRRALMNGRLDLEGVEGLSDLLSAETEYQRREALRRADGVLGRQLGRWSDRLLDIAARYEAAIDYDGDIEPDESATNHAVAALRTDIETALSRASAERVRDGLRVAIVGPVNAGKSSLFNAIVGADAAIVSATAGTTRDLIERPIVIEGIPFLLIDTAGIRIAADEIERIGIDRAHLARASADIVIDLETTANNPGVIAVSGKADISLARPDTLAVSATTGFGMDALLTRLAKAGRAMLPGEQEAALNQRYRRELDVVRIELTEAERQGDPILAAEHIRGARAALDRLTGTAGFEDMLDALFSRFCLGK